MIRINLLGVERARARKKLAFQTGQKLTVACSLVLILAALFIGWRYWSLSQQSIRVDADISEAQRETTRLHEIIQQVQEYEQRRTQLSERVALIEQLRKEQTGPVRMLDQISRALPPMLWLSALKQVGADVVIDGHSTTLTALSDFISNLESSGYFRRSIEIVNTGTETRAQPPGELIKFTIKAQFQTPGDPPAVPQPSGGLAGR